MTHEEIANDVLGDYTDTPSSTEQISESSSQADNLSEYDIIDVQRSRFSSALWFNNIKQEQVLLIGAGGIGSYVAFLLGRIGIKHLILFEFDRVDMVNLAGQLYTLNDISKPKIDVISEKLQQYSGFYNISKFEESYTSESMAYDVMMLGVDNMSTRWTAFNNWRDLIETKTIEDKSKCLFIDGRLDAEEFQVFCIQGDDEDSIKKYINNYLFQDWQAPNSQCSYKQTAFTANMIGSVMVNLFINFVVNETCEGFRSLPFKVSYNAATMLFKME